MQKRLPVLLKALVGLGALSIAPAASADEVVLGSLEPAASGGNHAMIAHKLTLAPEKPASVIKEPTYRYKPLYGTISQGDAENNKIVVVLDAPKGKGTPRLFVDGNGNGDLTDDPKVTLSELPKGTKTAPGAREAISSSEEGERLGASVPVLARYKIAGRGGTVPGTVQFVVWDGEVTYNREYARIGKLTVGSRAYKVALIDQGVDSRFDRLAHGEEDPAQVTLLIDKNADGIFDMKKEAYDASKPIRIGGGVYEVASIDVRGLKLTLKRSNKKIRGGLTAADLRVGGEAIDFETDLFEAKTVSFPDDYKGKLVLLDFWATWCPPCREEMPNVVRTYNQYHSHGFEILGISLDKQNQEKTLKGFLEEYGMPWKQVYDGGFWEAEIAKLYGINSIPNAFLVDGDTGKVLAMGDTLRGEGLAQEIEKALSRRKR